ncbi:RNA-processing protein, HAT helix [Artemisia annua]|uniref:RNA-processing protein, HAT helix n=1 Tax=Artemisia annua TaxID=35608 RepID=A0A2U1NAY0_ARTAN|nr:RNA-processing protein, HAT helix [Artemisia annua]
MGTAGETEHTDVSKQVSSITAQNASEKVTHVVEASIDSSHVATTETAEEVIAAAKAKVESMVMKMRGSNQRPYYHFWPLNAAELENWHNHIIEGCDDLNKVVNLYERCLIACANHPEYWIRYILCMEGRNYMVVAENALLELPTCLSKELTGDIAGAQASYLLVLKYFLILRKNVYSDFLTVDFAVLDLFWDAQSIKKANVWHLKLFLHQKSSSQSKKRHQEGYSASDRMKVAKNGTQNHWAAGYGVQPQATQDQGQQWPLGYTQQQGSYGTYNAYGSSYAQPQVLTSVPQAAAYASYTAS